MELGTLCKMPELFTCDISRPCGMPSHMFLINKGQKMISSLLTITTVVFSAALGVLIHSVFSAPEGREDAAGFHDLSTGGDVVREEATSCVRQVQQKRVPGSVAW